MKCLGLVTVSVLLAGASLPAYATTSNVAVDSLDGPWLQSLNPGLDYGVHDNAGPASVSSGFDFSAGGSFTITYLSGLTTPYGGGTPPYADAGGDTSYIANGNGGSSGTGFPSKYVDFSTSDVYLNELIGAFADAAGHVVGTPFAIGNGPFTIAAPIGASQLLLGVNDDIFADNSGSLLVSVSGPTAGAVPEPAGWAMMIGGFGAIGATMRARRRPVRVSYS